MGVTEPFFRVAKIKGVFSRVAMVTYCATNLTATHSAIGQLFDIISLASTIIKWL